MAPHMLHPGNWLAAIDGLSRIPAILVLGLSLSMLVFGLRFFKYYLLMGVGLGGWLLGTMLAGMMQVEGWYVALPNALILIGVALPFSKFGPPLAAGLLAGCGVGTIAANVLDVGPFWMAFAIGLFGGVVMAVIAPRFTTVLFCATCGAAGAIASVGAALRTSKGWLAPGAYVDYPVVYVIAGATLFITAMIVQVALEPDAQAGR